MSYIKLHDKYFRKFIPNQDIQEAINLIANKINSDFMNKEDILVISVLNGSFMYTAALVQRFEFCPEICFVKLASYDGTQSSGEVRQTVGLDLDVKGKNILIVEDIVDSGKTIVALHKQLSEAGVKSIAITSLFYKPNAYKQDLVIDYPALEIGNEFIVGYGLDYNQLGRHFEDIYIIDESK